MHMKWQKKKMNKIFKKFSFLSLKKCLNKKKREINLKNNDGKISMQIVNEKNFFNNHNDQHLLNDLYKKKNELK